MCSLLKLFLFVGVFILCTGCQKHYLTVSQQWVNSSYLASTSVDTPDPRQLDPPLGQLLMMEWYVPASILARDPRVELDLIYWDYTKEKVCFPIRAPLDWASFRCWNEKYAKTGGILTCKAAIVTGDGEIFREWRHQLWVNLIEVQPDNSSENSQGARG